MVRNLLLWPNPALRKRSEEVDSDTSGLSTLVDDMIDTMRHHHGVGLAAVQVGVLLRVVVLELEGVVDIWVNPRITYRSKEKELLREGCVSIPEFCDNISRHKWVEVSGQDAYGNPKKVMAHALRAQALQHEIDHLNGKMFPDRLDSGAKDRLRAHVRKLRGFR